MDNSVGATNSENQVDEEIVATVSDEALETAANTEKGQYFTFNFGNPICS